MVFEANLIFYYFMAMAVAVVLLEVTRGSIRPTAVAWLAGLTAVSCSPFRPALRRNDVGHAPSNTTLVPILIGGVVPILIGGVALLTVLIHLNRGGRRRDVWPWAAIAVLDLIVLLLQNAFNAEHGLWLWQIVLVVPGLVRVVDRCASLVRSPDQVGMMSNIPIPSTAPQVGTPEEHCHVVRRRRPLGRAARCGPGL